MNFSHRACQTDNGPDPYAGNIQQLAVQNEAFRVALWTGCHLQMTLMCIPPCGEIGPEVHEDTDQFIKVEQGTALVKMGSRIFDKTCVKETLFLYLREPGIMLSIPEKLH